MTGRPLRVLWAYDREHTTHPFIMLSVNTLVDAGMEVTVVSGDKAAEGARYRGLDDFSFQERIRNYQHLVHDTRKRLEDEAIACVHKAKKLRKPLKWEKEKLIKPLKPEERKRLRREALEADIRHGWLQAVRAVYKAYGNVRRLTWDTWKAYLRGSWRTWSEPADVIIASRPQSAMVAWLAAKLRGRRFVYFSFELFGEQIAPASPILALLERLMLRFGVDAVLTQNDCRAEVLRKERGSRVQPLLVHNYKPIHWTRRPGGKLRAMPQIGEGKRIVLYEGMIVDGRWLEYVAQSVLHLPEDVVVVLMGQQKMKWGKVHAEEIKDALATGRLVIAPPVPHHDLPDYVADADVGVIIYDDSVRNNYFCEPGKLSDYISVGVPVAAPNFPTIGPVVTGYDIGRCWEGHSPQAIAATLMTVLDRPKPAWAQALERACSELTWETQAPNLLAAVTGGVDRRNVGAGSPGADAARDPEPASARSYQR